MSNDIKARNALREIKAYCSEVNCDECAICDWCSKEIGGVTPNDWDICIDEAKEKDHE